MNLTREDFTEEYFSRNGEELYPSGYCVAWAEARHGCQIAYGINDSEDFDLSTCSGDKTFFETVDAQDEDQAEDALRRVFGKAERTLGNG